jgi:hypothetical protein
VLGALAVTVSVKVTDCPEFDGFSEEVTSEVVVSVLTVTVDIFVVAEPPLFVNTAWR